MSIEQTADIRMAREYIRCTLLMYEIITENDTMALENVWNAFVNDPENCGTALFEILQPQTAVYIAVIANLAFSLSMIDRNILDKYNLKE